MGTRGAIGFRIDGQDKVTYNHFDSYPTGVGTDVVEFIREWLADGRETMRDAARAVVVINDKIPPTPEHIAKLSPIADLDVSDRSLDDWYCLTRNMQGDLGAYLKHGLLTDGHDFMRNSLFCEWAYVVNLDDFSLEVYRGFQKEPHSSGRYSGLAPDRGYYPVALVKSFALDDIPQNWIEQVDPPGNEG